MSHAGSWLCGQTPTQANAQALIGRLHRQAQLQPAKALACLAEAETIQALAEGHSLPEGRPASPLPTRRERPKGAGHVYVAWHYLYKALSGRQPPAAPHDSKIQGKWGQFYFLRADARLTMGLTLRRSMALPHAQREALLAEGKARLSPQVATLDDVKQFFSKEPSRGM